MDARVSTRCVELSAKIYPRCRQCAETFKAHENKQACGDYQPDGEIRDLGVIDNHVKIMED